MSALDILSADRQEIATFVKALFRYADENRFVSIRAFKDTKDSKVRENAQTTFWSAPRLNGTGMEPVVDGAVQLANACAQAPVPAVCCPPVCTFSSPASATEADVANGVVIAVECDARPNWARETLEAILGPATIIVASGGEWADPETGEVQAKLHLYWRLRKPTRTPEEHTLLKEARRLATLLVGADKSAVPLSHPLRWPGSWHRKGAPKIARIVTLNEDAEIDLGEALDTLRNAVSSMPDAPQLDTGPHETGELTADEGDIAAALDVIPNDFPPKDSWDGWNRIAMATWAATGGSAAGLDMFLEWSTKSPLHDPATTEEKWEHLGEYPPTNIGAGTLFYLAQQAQPGWRKPSNIPPPPTGDPFEDFGNGHTKFRQEDESDFILDAKSDKKKHGFRLVLFDDMQPQVGSSYLVKQLLSSTGMTVIYGEAGTGKTFFALHLGLCIAAGGEFFDRRVQRGAVLYIAAEAGRSIENRIAAAKHELEFPEMMPFAAITSPIDLCKSNVDVSRLAELIRETDLGMPLALIVIDTLSRVLAGGNENAPDDMGALVRNLDRLRDETGAAIAIVHHSGKDTARGARGHSLLRAATDSEIEVTRDENAKLSTARVTKQRDFSTDGSFSFTLRQVEVGIDEDGDPVTSCVVEQAEGSSVPRKKQGNLSPATKTALRLLHDAVGEGGETPPGSNHIPQGVRCVTEDLWRRYCYTGGISTGDQEAKKKAFGRAHDALLAAGRIQHWGGWVWPVV